ncbi:glycosyltransferase [Alteromonas sp. 345S023]|uniref:Glycosyltransferase n=1 Tax=Alteromonas profundi TaxID=2696062 RepID=A0A7X5LIG7_9ALTE|nr:glycosyltransferase [Alteromonas profundi]NDV89960.1 glycosyltransferase [Alteromonas profundi]
MIENDPRVTVIIPTYHDWERLTACLDALKLQTYDAHLVEILVVNNDPCDVPPALSLAENVTILAESKPGSYAARNLGLAKSTGEIIFFTDSDCKPANDWIENAVAVFKEKPDVERVAGRVKVFSAHENFKLIELYDSVFAFQQCDYVKSGFAVTANLAVRRRCFENVGIFNADLMSGGDVEWNLKATEAGFLMRYCSNVVVQHPARDTLNELLVKAKRVAGGRYKKERFQAIKWSFTRGILPPTGAYKTIVQARLNSTKSAIILFLLFYMLKVYTSINIWLLALNLAQPSRK